MPSNSPADLLPLIGRIYDCVLRSDDWTDVLETIAESVGGLNASISVQDPVSRKASFSAEWAVPSDAVRLYNEKYASLNPVLTSGWFCELDQPISAARYVGQKDYFSSRYAREFLKPLGWGDAIGSHLAKLSSRYGILCIFGPWLRGSFGDRDLSYVEALSPHVRRAVQLSELLGPQNSQKSFESTTLELLRTGVVLVDASKRIVFCNSAANELISRSASISRRGDHLQVADMRSAGALATAIDTAMLGTAAAIPENGIPLVLGATSGPQVVAWVLPLKRHGRSAGAQALTPQVAIFLQEMGDSAPLAGELFVKRFAITESECRVLMLLVQGHSPNEIADWLGSSLPTVRTHLSRLFAKTETKSQTQLMRLAMTALSPARLPGQ